MAKNEFKPFFPKFLNKGSDGPAVMMLQSWLLLLGFVEVQMDGYYGDVTAAAVSGLQHNMGVEVDGNFGPDTRKAFLKWHRIDVDAIPASKMAGKTNGVGPMVDMKPLGFDR